MHLVDTAGHVDHRWVAEDLTQNPPRPPTEIGPDFMNAVMLELANIVTLNGGVLDKDDNTQVYEHINAMIVASISALGNLVTVSNLQKAAHNFTVAGGAADAITGVYAPAIITDTAGRIPEVTLAFKALAANTLTTTTFDAGTGAFGFIKGATAAIASGDIPGAGAIMWVRGRRGATAADDRWVLLNPATGVSNQSAGNGLKNRIINGTMKIDQRNAGAVQTITAGATLAYTVDRWYAYCTGANLTGQQIALANGQNRYKFTGAAGVTGVGIGQRIESKNCLDLAGQTVSLQVKASSSSLISLGWAAYYATTADVFGTLATPTRTLIASGNFAIGVNEASYSVPIAIPAAATTGIEVVFTGGALLAAQTLQIGDVQLEVGTSSTSIEQRPYGLELTLCQRYYEKSYDMGIVPGTVAAGGAMRSVSVASGGGNVAIQFCYKAEKRAVPTVTPYSPATGATGVIRDEAGADRTASIYCAGMYGVVLSNAGTTTGGTGHQGHITADAEL